MASINAMDPEKYPALYRATERGKEFAAKEREGWAQVAELRRTRQGLAADRLVKQLLGVKGEPMPEDVKAALRAKRAAMTDQEKKAERDERRTNRVLQKLAARATGKGLETTNNGDDAMAKKTGAKSVKAAAKAKETKAPKAAKAPKERDPRLPAPGSVIERKYKDQILKVKVLESGFEFEGTQYPSLTALALKITGAKAISGPAFFGLTKQQPAVEAK